MKQILFTAFIAITGNAILISQDTLLLFNPTASNLAVIENLASSGFLDLEGYHVQGIFHVAEDFDYQEAQEAIAALTPNRYSLKELTCRLGPEEVFGTNPCTEAFRSLFSGSSGALFMGGPDIPPGLYGEQVHLLTLVTDPYRHYLETSFLFHLLGGTQDALWDPFMALRPGYLVSGICLGMQTMNVATGGTLIQDIPTEVYGLCTAEELLSLPPDQVHRNYSDMLGPCYGEPTSYHFHRIKFSEGSFLKQLAGTMESADPLVLSSHHQSVDRPGKGWVVAARSIDGKIIEAIEHADYPHVIGIQFHPEKPALFDPAIVQKKSCDERISFHEVIRENASYEFHVNYWKYVGRILQELKQDGQGTIRSP